MQHIYIFLDESGNSGRRFWDIQQPSYLEGGWAIEAENVNRIADAIKEIEAGYTLDIKEIKGKKLVKHKRGQQLILQLIESIGSNGGIPILHLIEKKYFVCARIVETFLDPLYNPKVPLSDQLNLEKRQGIAEILYETGSPLIEEFAEAYRTKNRSAITTNAKRWSLLLKTNKHYELSDLIDGVIPNILECLQAEFSVSESPAFEKVDSINIPAWFYMFQHIEQNIPCQCTIIHDKIDTFEEAYKKIFNMLKNAKKSSIYLQDRKIVFPLEKIKKLKFEDSRSSPVIRAADLVVGCASYYIDQVQSDHKISNALNRIGFLTLGLFLMDIISYQYPSLGGPLRLGTVIASTTWIGKIIKALTHKGGADKLLK